MKIDSNYDSFTGKLHLVFDAQSQRILRRASTKMKPLFKREPSPLQRWLDEEADEDIGAPLRLIAAMASASSRSMRVRPVAMARLLGLVSVAALRLYDMGQPVKPLDQALILLAKATPMLVLVEGLPPAPHIWNRTTISPAVWKSYESLRCRGPQSVPHLPVLRMHYLWQELKGLSRPSPSLRKLIATLDASTCLFRMTVEALGGDEKEGA